MKRNAATTAAATASLAAVAVTMGIALNLGILSSGNAGAKGMALAADKTPVPTTVASTSTTAATVPQTEYVTVYEDIPAGATASGATSAPAAAPAVAGETVLPDPESTSGGAAQSHDSEDPARESERHDGEDGHDGHDGHESESGSSHSTASSSATYTVADVGTINADVSSSSMTVVSTSPASGWTADVLQAGGQEVSVRFTGPTGTIVWKAHVEDGGVRVELSAEGTR